MTDKKYKIRRDLSMEYAGHKLYRIEALKNFGHIIAGDIGGYIEKEDNLSQYNNNCWISNNAKVMDNATVQDNAFVSYGAIVKDSARIYNNAIISGFAVISDYAIVRDNAVVNSNAKVKNSAKIQDMVTVMDRAVIKDNAIINNYAEICGDAIVSNESIISGNAVIYGEANIENTTDVLVIGPIGSRNKYTTFMKQQDNIYVRCGCFFDTIDNFAKEVTRRHETNNHAINYMSAIDFVKIYFNNTLQI